MKDLVFLMIIGILAYDAATGEVHTRGGGVIRRKEHPLLYWICTAVQIAIALVLLFVVVYDLFYREFLG
jgi:uncharacterized membrane protein YidH (DUF202 family)